MIVMHFFAYTLVECTVYVRGGAICARQLNPSMPPCHAWREKDGGIDYRWRSGQAVAEVGC